MINEQLIFITRCIDTNKALYKLASEIREKSISNMLQGEADDLLSTVLFALANGIDSSKQSIVLQLDLLDKLITIYSHLDVVNKMDSLIAIRSVLRLKSYVLQMRTKKISKSGEPSREDGSRREPLSDNISQVRKVSRISANRTTPIQDRILAVVKEAGQISTKNIYSKIDNVSNRTVRRNVIPLVQTGRLKREQQGRDMILSLG